MIFDAIVRMSRIGYRDENLRSDAEQEADIRAWAKRSGNEIRRVHIERDESGKTTNRKALREAKEAALNGEVDGIVAAYLSRFSRNTVEGLELVQDLIDAGREFVPLDLLGVDFRSPTGEYILTNQLA